MKNNSAFCLIPARGGSKRLPGKNTIPLQGKPLLAYTIEAALQSNVFDDVYVSSDNEEILKIAKDFGASTLVRPAEFATDKVMMPAVCINALDTLKDQGKEYEYFAMLQPTSPLRTSEDICKAYEMLREKNASSLVSVTPFMQPVQRAVSIASGFVRPFFSVEQMEKGEQDYERLFSCHGAICMARCAAFLQNKSFLVEDTLPYELPIERAVDINDETELRWAEFLLSQRQLHKT